MYSVVENIYGHFFSFNIYYLIIIIPRTRFRVFVFDALCYGTELIIFIESYYKKIHLTLET